MYPKIIDYFLNFLEPYYGEPTLFKKEKYTNKPGIQIFQHLYEWKQNNYRFNFLIEQPPNIFISISSRTKEDPYDKLLDGKIYDTSLG